MLIVTLGIWPYKLTWIDIYFFFFNKDHSTEFYVNFQEAEAR